MSAGVAFETSESAILARVLRTDCGTLSAEMARYFLQLDFPPHDRRRMDDLAVKARQNQLSSNEQAELESFCHVGELLDVSRGEKGGQFRGIRGPRRARTNRGGMGATGTVPVRPGGRAGVA